MAKAVTRYEGDFRTLMSGDTYDEGSVADNAATTPRRLVWKNTGDEQLDSVLMRRQQVGANDGWTFLQIAEDQGQLTDPVVAPTGVKKTGAGLEIGDYKAKVVFYNAEGETVGSAASAIVATTSGDQQITWTIPVGGAGTVGRKVYRTVVGATGTYKLAKTVANNVDVTVDDDTADGSLGVVEPSANSTGSEGAWGTADVVIGTVAVNAYVACWARYNVPISTTTQGNPRQALVTFMETS